jgi:hypothetical protein
MEKNPPDKMNLKPKRLRCRNSEVSKSTMVSLEKDLDGCLLVIPESFSTNRLPAIHPCGLCDNHL